MKNRHFGVLLTDPPDVDHAPLIYVVQRQVQCEHWRGHERVHVSLFGWDESMMEHIQTTRRVLDELQERWRRKKGTKPYA